MPRQKPKWSHDRVEVLASAAHDAWMRLKRTEGFHEKTLCPRGPDGPCPKCRADMVPYQMLPEQLKAFGREMVQAVLDEIMVHPTAQEIYGSNVQSLLQGNMMFQLLPKKPLQRPSRGAPGDGVMALAWYSGKLEMLDELIYGPAKMNNKDLSMLMTERKVVREMICDLAVEQLYKPARLDFSSEEDDDDE